MTTTKSAEEMAEDYANGEMIELRGYDAGSLGYKHVRTAFLAGFSAGEERGAKSMLDYIISYMNLPDCSVDNFAGFKESHMKTWREQYCK